MSMSSISAKILSDPVNRWVFSSAGVELYLVGGFLRDILLSRRTEDADYVVRGDPEVVARRTSRKFSGTLISLGRNQTFRIVLKNKRSVDFSRLDTPISENLQKRDFTINAMAWGPSDDIIDPHGGLHDLKKKVIRVVRPENLREDPLRILRAYRHALQLGFRIQDKTRKGLRRYADHLSEVAPERITEELCKILNHMHADSLLSNCHEDKILSIILSITDDRLKENLKLLRKYRLVTGKIRNEMKRGSRMKKWDHFLDEEISQGLTRAGLVRLSILLRNVGYGRGREKSLRFSSIISGAVRSIHSGLSYAEGALTEKKLYEIFRSSGRYHIETAHILSAARSTSYGKILKSAEEYQKINSKSLLTGEDIKELLNLNQGVLIGKIQSDLQEKRFLKKVKTKADARAWIISNYT
jgi:tRNA nucleotidyltransferase (CCA-adding enzyme)